MWFESLETGFSMATRRSIYRRWFCITCRVSPSSSKWLPQLSGPKASLKVRVLLTMLNWLQTGPKVPLANLGTLRVWTIFLPR